MPRSPEKPVIIEAAINLLKVFIGLRYARPMRLPHTAPSRNRETCVLTEVDRQVTWTWHGASLEGALVAGMVVDSFRSATVSLLRTYIGTLPGDYRGPVEPERPISTAGLTHARANEGDRHDAE